MPERGGSLKSSHHECIVVGAGLLGLATAWTLSRRGHEVIVLDAYEPGHSHAGSKGSARIFRLSYPDPLYVTMAAESLALWHMLEEDSGRTLLHHRPLINIGQGLGELATAMDAVGAPYSQVEPAAGRELFPSLTISGPGLAEETGGVLIADDCLKALHDTGGFEVFTGSPVAEITDDADGVSVTTDDRTTLSTNVVINCAGFDALSLFGHRTVPTAAVPTLQQVVYLEPLQPDVPVPLFIEWGERTVYGLPVMGQSLLKLSHHTAGPPYAGRPSIDEDDPDLLQLLHDAAVRLLPSFSPVPVATERCIYDNTTDTDFIIDRIGNVVVGCGTSGHGFKFGPLLGELLADLATDATPRCDLTRFALHRSFLRLLTNP
jgi:sarcosine oxidase